jgi:hypothetical protein
MHGSKKAHMPAFGDAFLVPLAPGVNTFCWVVRLHAKRATYGGKKLGNYVIHDLVIACASWTGQGKPTQAELDAREVREAFDQSAPTLVPIGQLALVASSPPPKRWAKLGKVKRPDVKLAMITGGVQVHANGTRTPSPSYAGFAGLQGHAARAWQMARGARKVVAAEAAADAAVDAQNAAEARADQAPIEARRRAKLPALATLDLLPEWKGLVHASHRKRVAQLLGACVAELRALRKPTRATKLAVIERTVLQLNAWNDRTGVIETPEREALCTAIDDIGRAAGLRGRDLAGPFRDW